MFELIELAVLKSWSFKYFEEYLSELIKNRVFIIVLFLMKLSFILMLDTPPSLLCCLHVSEQMHIGIDWSIYDIVICMERILVRGTEVAVLIF